MTYNWCHGPSCHERATMDRIRGSKGNKVIRTRKIALTSEYRRNSVWSHFCSQGCCNDFMREYWQRAIALGPRPNALETPIKVKKEKYENYRYRYDSVNGQQRIPFTSTRTIINSVDND